MAEFDNRIKKPAHPAPPLNVDKNARKRSVYDEIAERRKTERHKIGVTAPEDRGDEDIKVYKRSKPVPEKKTDPIKQPESEARKIEEENFDVPPIPKKKRKIGFWAAVISILSVLCAAAGIAYCAVNGLLDGLISML